MRSSYLVPFIGISAVVMAFVLIRINGSENGVHFAADGPGFCCMHTGSDCEPGYTVTTCADRNGIEFSDVQEHCSFVCRTLRPHVLQSIIRE